MTKSLKSGWQPILKCAKRAKAYGRADGQVTGYTIATVWDWEHGRNKAQPETSEIIKKAKEFLRVFDAKLLLEGAVNPVAYIFRAKNYYGMKDQQEYVLTPNPMGDGSDPKAIADKYRDTLPDVTIAPDDE